jgi:chromosomal replication initiation ATPase DnaA
LTLSHVVILHGGTGRGKSHLAEAFAASLLQQSPSLRKVMYLLLRAT